MRPMDKLSRRSASRQGVLTTADLADTGLSSRRRGRLRTDGTLTPVRRGITAVAAVPDTERGRMALACVATAGAVSLNTAARFVGFRRVIDDGLIHVTIPSTRRVELTGLDHVVVHHSSDLPDSDLVAYPDGVRVTAPWRIVFDMAARVSDAVLESMIEQGLNEGWFTVAKLWSVAARLTGRGRPGSGRFLRVLSSRPAWRRPVDSDLELRLERALVATGLPEPSRQHPVSLRDGAVVHPDLSWPDIRLAVEVDHISWHGGRVDRQYDQRRDRQLRLVGWQVERIPDDEIRARLNEVAAEVAELHAERSRSRPSADATL